MSAGIPPDEIHAFYHFLGRRIENPSAPLSPEESVQEFRLYQQELNRFIEETQPALEQSERGESRPLDVDALMQRVRNRLTKSES
ncbi:MAG TPA: hypothetical protein VMM76_03600 [Pirellulaceae bacterium]|nr:hypothetical protein [Pirellulaceae bacterium]